jgi:hypothetical protein
MEHTSKMLFSQYNNADLMTLTKALEQDNFEVLTILSIAAQKQSARLSILEALPATSQYISLCNRLIDEIQQLIRGRRTSLIPYVNRLYEKETGNHDCRNCSGFCNMQHNSQLMELQDSHNRIKDILHKLPMVGLPLYSDTIYPDAYRILRSQMALLENSLTELFFIEEVYLIPKVIEAQKKIYAHNDANG